VPQIHPGPRCSKTCVGRVLTCPVLCPVLCLPADSALTVFAPCDDAVKTWCKEKEIHFGDLLKPEMATKLLEVSLLWPRRLGRIRSISSLHCGGGVVGAGPVC
jgi:hypothetical protein